MQDGIQDQESIVMLTYYLRQRHISYLGGTFAYTSHIQGDTAFVEVETEIENLENESKNIWVEIEINSENVSDSKGTGKVKVHVPAGEVATGKVLIPVRHVQRWDIDHPNIYKVQSKLVDKGDIIDQHTTSFGIREISVDPINGFMLNGRTVNLKGGCVHHDNGILGAASFKDSEYRRMKIHKENGFNAIRFAHNPMSRDLLDACDRLGLLVINEAFDVWTMEKNTHDYSQYFKDHWQKDMEAFIKRDRNHPSVIMWSTGNEVLERGGLSNGYEWSNKLADYVRELDATRFVTNSIPSFFNGLDDEDQYKFFMDLMKSKDKNQAGGLFNLDAEHGRNVWWDYTEPFVAPLDVVGYNYFAKLL
ncbi:glycoside hydrolase family 2 TIM barrel-domain containing protein [Gracilibacillus sp. HCP3S3_G5_1]|uniref:glycoside hydrolase family 2 TIM barrel-domain containing protein n=1 Tax=unclassified Gracilibacillus TaxID=2625209 RepID=UPI003F8C18F9